MLRQQNDVEEPIQQQQKIWSNGEKAMRTPRNVAQSATNVAQSSTTQNKKFTRDSINSRMGDRDLIIQVGGNPFLSNNNYIQDMAMRDQFLVARDSNFQ